MQLTRTIDLAGHQITTHIGNRSAPLLVESLNTTQAGWGFFGSNIRTTGLVSPGTRFISNSGFGVLYEQPPCVKTILNGYRYADILIPWTIYKISLRNPALTSEELILNLEMFFRFASISSPRDRLLYAGFPSLLKGTTPWLNDVEIPVNGTLDQVIRTIDTKVWNTSLLEEMLDDNYENHLPFPTQKDYFSALESTFQDSCSSSAKLETMKTWAWKDACSVGELCNSLQTPRPKTFYDFFQLLLQK